MKCSTAASVLAGTVLAISACSGSSFPRYSSSTPSSALPASPTTALASPTTPSPAPTIPSTAPAPTTFTRPPPVDTSSWKTSPVTVKHNITVPPIPVLADIRAATHNGYERITFDFSNHVPGYTVAYVQHPTEDASGAIVSSPGKYYLQVRFDPADAHTQSGTPTIPHDRFLGFPQVKSWKVTGDFEAVTTIIIGTNSVAPFQVKELSSPLRVYIDIASPGDSALDGK